MQLTVLEWLKDFLVTFIGRAVEILFRGILLILPLGVYLWLIQNREKASTIRNISVYTTDESKWQHIFPGFILVAIDPNAFKKSVNKIRSKVQIWIMNNKYILSLLFAASIVILMVLKGAY